MSLDPIEGHNISEFENMHNILCSTQAHIIIHPKHMALSTYFCIFLSPSIKAWALMNNKFLKAKTLFYKEQ